MPEAREWPLLRVGPEPPSSRNIGNGRFHRAYPHPSKVERCVLHSGEKDPRPPWPLAELTRRTAFGME